MVRKILLLALVLGGFMFFWTANSVNADKELSLETKQNSAIVVQRESTKQEAQESSEPDELPPKTNPLAANRELESIAWIRSVVDPKSRENSDFRDVLGGVIQDLSQAELQTPNQGESERIDSWLGDTELISQLRYTGELLENKSNQLENERSYQRADRLRRLAKKLRRCAREFDLPQDSEDSVLAPDR